MSIGTFFRGLFDLISGADIDAIVSPAKIVERGLRVAHAKGNFVTPILAEREYEARMAAYAARVRRRSFFFQC